MYESVQIALVSFPRFSLSNSLNQRNSVKIFALKTTRTVHIVELMHDQLKQYGSIDPLTVAHMSQICAQPNLQVTCSIFIHPPNIPVPSHGKQQHIIPMYNLADNMDGMKPPSTGHQP